MDLAETPLVVIAGPTGTGKTGLAIEIARQIGGEIVNYDSVQIYRGFDIGSAKPAMSQRAEIPHHLFDIISADEPFTAADFARHAAKVCVEIEGRQRRPVLVGGTSFYLRAFLAGLPELPAEQPALRSKIARIRAGRRGPERLHALLKQCDPDSAARIAPADSHRVERALEVFFSSGRPISSWRRPTAESPEKPSVKIALELPRELLMERLDHRVQEMYREGLIEETRRLMSQYDTRARPFSSIGYHEAVAVVAGTLSESQAISETRRRTRAYAKRQMTWLRGERNVHWFRATENTCALAGTVLATLSDILRTGS